MSVRGSAANRGSGSRMSVRQLTTMAMLAALGVVAVALIEVPIFPPPAAFLKYDPADIPILIGTMVYGPVSGLILTVVVSFIQSFMIHGSGGPIGFVMHVIATGAMVLVCGLIYKRGKPTIARAAAALGAGSLAMVVCMVGMNLVLTPIFMGAPIEQVKSMLIPFIIPFNVFKAGLNSAITFFVYRYVEKLAVRR